MRVLGYVGPGARTVGDVVDGMLVSGDADEYDVLRAVLHLAELGVVRIERPEDVSGEPGETGEAPQPELER